MRVLDSDWNQSDKEMLYQFTNGIEFDVFLARQEVAVQKAWVRALGNGNYLTSEEMEKLSSALDEALDLMLKNKFEWRVEDEDIHMNIERFLTETLGPIGEKVHLGRSRNDLIATTLRLYAAEESDYIGRLVRKLGCTLINCSEKWIDVIIPGMTHMQSAQPIRLSHVTAAHAQTLVRDLRRMQFSKQSCLESMPLGSSAISGTPLAVDLHSMAEELGFVVPSKNSCDSVSDRDFLLDLMNAVAILAAHISRLCEDVIFLSSTPVAVFVLSKDWSTGSSVMPNKRNPDVVELVRAKMTQLILRASEGCTIMKSLPSGYGSDLHELKILFIQNTNDLKMCLKILIPFFETLEADKGKAEQLLNQGHILATEIADQWVRKGQSFREAYRTTAQLVRRAQSSGHQVHQVTNEVVTFEQAVENRKLIGGTSRERVLEQIGELREAFGSIKSS